MLFGMERIEDILAKLNDEQIQPVKDTEGAVLVIAGAGSGKTRVLTSRIAYLVMGKGVSPSEIMAITFTNKAAGEMKERLSAMIGDVSDMWVSTIHSMCVKILRRDITALGYDRNFSIFDETDKDKALKKVFEDLKLEADKMLKTVKTHISIAKNECLLPDEYKRLHPEIRFIDEICDAYAAYDKYLESCNALDFDDLLFKTHTLFSEFPEIADKYSEHFKYIHIDEFQDTNRVQFLIAKRLAKTHGNIFVVGDDDQSIYSWRGADVKNILDFDKTFRGAKVYKLQQNYRSTKKILELANCIIANNTGRRAKELWTENDDGVKVETYTAVDELGEAGFVALQIKNLMARTDLKYGDFAVFMRVNALSRAFEQEFTKYAIPYRIYGGFRFFERKEIKDVLAYLRLIVNPHDNVSFLRAVATPRRGIGEKTLRELHEYASANIISLYEASGKLDETSIGGAAKIKLFNFKLMLDGFKIFAENRSVCEVIDKVLEDTRFLEQFAEKNEENTSKLMNIDELKNSADEFVKANVGTGLADYLNSVTLSSDTDAINEDDAVTVATIHASKGLEYKCVFVAGLDDKILPIERSFFSEEDMEEERRLMYVAVTRARERLYLTRASSRYMYGRRDYMTKSRFLKEAEPVLGASSVKNASYSANDDGYGARTGGYGYKSGSQYTSTYSSYGEKKYGGRSAFGSSMFNDEVKEEPVARTGSGYSSGYAKTFLKENKPVENKKASFGEYKSGVKVKHAKFGEGIVITVKGSGDNIIIDVAFKGVGIKSLSAKFAPLEIIK